MVSERCNIEKYILDTIKCKNTGTQYFKEQNKNCNDLSFKSSHFLFL
jgi:hypothetical protein